MNTLRIRASKLVISLLLLLATLGLSPTDASAQSGTALDLVIGADLTLDLTPPQAAPGESVHISARSLLLDLTAMNIKWSADGAVTREGVGMTEIDLVAPAQGKETVIRASVFEGGVLVVSQTAHIRPVELDLLWEADSYVPPYFNGRALPSAGTRLKLEAIPHFTRTNGTPLPTSEISFTWRRNGYVIAGASGRGRARVIIPAPALFGTDTIAVETQSADGTYRASASVRIPSVEPRLVLYEKHPLFGTMHYRALSRESEISDVEVRLVATPYYAEATSANDGVLDYQWRVNGTRIPNDPEAPSEITIDARGSNGVALIELLLTHLTNIFTESSGSWRLTFPAAGANTLNNPFTNPQ